MPQSTGILLVQLGSPKSPTAKDLKTYLRDFLSDPRLIRNQNFAWKALLNLVILPTRSPVSAKLYQNIWTDEGAPLVFHTEAFAQKVQAVLAEYPVEYSFAIGDGPKISDALAKLKEKGVEHVKVVPLFPQFAEGTSMSVVDATESALSQMSWDVSREYLQDFHQNGAYIRSQARLIDQTLKENSPDVLLLSFHGYPKERVFNDHDPYYCHCINTAEAIAHELKEISSEKIVVAFQSQFGRKEWVGPSTQTIAEEFPKQGVKNLVVACPAFTVDNLETLEEINISLREDFIKAGGEHFETVPCLNDDDLWCQEFGKEVVDSKWESVSPEERYLSQKWKEKDFKFPLSKLPKDLAVSAKTNLEKPSQGLPPENLSPEARKTLKIVFLIMFLDLAGFSIIFPLFPSLLEYYLGQEGQSGLLHSIVVGLKSFSDWAGATSDISIVVLFGGLLSFLYSGLQFLGAPFFGALSDKIGRRSVLLVSMVGIALSYLMWGFAGSFTVLVAGRFLGGLMGSNITTATAVVSDITNVRTRSKGMAVIGIAFGLGFLFGPAIGGLSSKINLLDFFPALEAYGVNPFSTPAFIAFLFSMTGLHFLFHHFKETLPSEKRGKGQVFRSVNPFVLFSNSKYPGVTEAAMANFFFLLFFSGAEFTLTFLTFERLGYSSAENGAMFIFIGIVLMFVQGGIVRRKAAIVGERSIAKQGLLILVPGLLLIGFAFNSFVLFVGLFLMAVGSAMVIPTITSLASFGAPASEQGRILGVFRSLGALGRTIGPLLACVLYWKYEASIPYVIGAVALILPFLFVKAIAKDSITPTTPPEQPTTTNPLGVSLEASSCSLGLGQNCYCKK